jgi:hypothetical protein
MDELLNWSGQFGGEKNILHLPVVGEKSLNIYCSGKY